MADERRARDGFERYYAEKLWELVPSVYKLQDGSADTPTPGALRALIEIIAEQAAVLRRSHDRLWDDQYVELADDWAVAYLADLVGARLVSAHNKAGRRVDVAKTIYYRRRKGTLPLLEELIVDIARWEGKVVEQFRRLGRARHRLDSPPAPARFSGTMPGGWADLRSANAAAKVYGPFDEYAHTPDVRRHRGLDGRYGIHKLAFHLYRLQSLLVSGVTPRLVSGTSGFTVDPSGRDVPLFVPRNRPANWNQWRSAEEWELPTPLSIQLLNHAEFVVLEGIVRTLITEVGLSGPAAQQLRSLRGVRFRDERRFRATLETLPASAELLSDLVYNRLVELAIVADCGKAALLPGPGGATGGEALVVTESARGIVPRHETLGAHLGGWTSPLDARLLVDPPCGRLLFTDGPGGGVTVDYYYGSPGDIGAGTYDRRSGLVEQPDSIASGGGTGLDFEHILNDGVCEVADSATYEPVSDKLAVRNLTVQAANGQRPYLLPGANWVLNAGSHQDARATLDGLWVGGVGGEVIFRAERDEVAGSYERVVIRHCTLDPGGEAADRSTIHPVPLLVDCRVEELVIQGTITGPIYTTERGVIERLVICDSIVQSLDPAAAAIDLDAGEVHLQRVTVLGAVNVHRLWASEAIVTGPVTVADTQAGCFRFSAAPAGSVLPFQYRSFTIGDSRGYFVSQRFGDPGYGMLSDSAPAEVRTGGEDGAEMGAFSGLNYQIRRDSLLKKVGEYAPFGLVPLTINET